MPPIAPGGSSPLLRPRPEAEKPPALLVLTPLRPTPGCTLRTGGPGWPAAAPWRAGRPPGRGASLWWSPSSARRPLSTPGRRWSSGRTELLSVPAGKKKTNGIFHNNVGGQKLWCERGKYLPQTLLARPTRGTVGGSFHTRCLDGEKHRAVSV